MHNYSSDVDPQNDDPLDDWGIARQCERLSNLQYIVALLIQKNEEMRQQLAERASEDGM